MSTSPQGRAYIGVDTTNLYPNGGPGRPAIRLVSNNAYTHGLFIMDLVHMPFGCGTWPAYWLLGPNWPSNGEIDIIEGVNTIDHNSMSLHTSINCTISGAAQSGDFQTSDCNKDVNQNSGCGSAANNAATPNNYGSALNNNGGGVYATEWTSNYIKTWYFGRNNIPSSITNGAPDVAQFGLPVYNAQGECPIDQHFNNMSIIINTDFCGDYAGNVFTQYADCPASPGQNSWGSCVNYVGNNPSAFTEAYWSINSVRVYQMPQGAQPASSYSTSLSSVSVSASSNTLNMGMGATTSGLSSSVYTGSLSSISSAKSSTATSVAVSSPSTSSSRTRTRPSTTPSSSAISSVASTSSTQPAISQTPSVSSTFSSPSASSTLLSSSATSSSLSGSWSAVSSSQSSSSSAEIVGSSTTSPAPVSPTASAGLQCPSANGTAYTDPAGNRYIIICGVTTNPGNIGYVGKPDLESCINACYETSDCVGVNFYFDGGCFFKHEFFSTTPNENVAAAILASLVETASSTASSMASTTADSAASSLSMSLSSTSPSPTALCPSVDGTTLTDSNGKKYNIECGSDTTFGSFTTLVYNRTDFTQCMTGCDATEGCAAWTWVPYPYPGGICYLKNAGAAFAPGAADDVAGVLVTSPSASSSSAVRTSVVGTSMVSSGSSAGTSNAQGSSSFATSSSSIGRTSSTVSSSSLALCPTATCGATSVASPSASVAPCQDPYGNAFSVNCGIQYIGTIQRRLSAPDVNTCLLNCDTTNSCVAINYANGTCSLLSDVTNTTTVQNVAGVAGATRPAGVSTVYTMFPTASTAMQMTTASDISTSMQADTSTGSVIYGTSSQQVSSGSSSTTSLSPVTATSQRYTASPCPTASASLCASSDSKKTCSSLKGNNYDVTCGIQYEGTVIDTSGIGTSPVRVKRAVEPTFNDCQSLCDQTAGCVALNYQGTDCELLSSVTGTTNVPGAIGASISTGSVPDPTCPGSANKLFTDSNGVSYNIGCYTDYAGNSIGNPLNAASFSVCLSYCDSLSGCSGVEFDFRANMCTLKSAWTGIQTSNTNVIYGVKNRAATGGNSVNPTPTLSTTLCESMLAKHWA